MAEQIRSRKRRRQVVVDDVVDTPYQIASARQHQLGGRTKRSSLEQVRVGLAMRVRRRLSAAKVSRYERVDYVVGNRWMRWSRGKTSEILIKLGLMMDQDQSAGRLEDLVDDVGDLLFVRPVKRLGERHCLESPEVEQWDIFCAAHYPRDLSHSREWLGCARLVEHRLFGIQSDHIGEARGESESNDASSTTYIEKAA